MVEQIKLHLSAPKSSKVHLRTFPQKTTALWRHTVKFVIVRIR